MVPFHKTFCSLNKCNLPTGKEIYDRYRCWEPNVNSISEAKTIFLC